MRDRVVEHPNRYKLTPVSEDVYDLTPEPGIVTEEGTDLNKANLLSDATAAALGLVGDVTVDDALYGIALNWAFVPPLSKCTWDEVDFYAANSDVARAWSVGDTKDVTIGSETITFQIADFNHDDLASGGKAAVSFIMKDLLATTQRMNPTNTTIGSWNASEMRTIRVPAYLSQLPADLRAVIKPVVKRTTAGNAQTSIQSTTDSLWLASRVEVWGSGSDGDGYKDEGTRYPVFIDNASRIKRLSNGEGDTYLWWLRSPGVSSATHFNEVLSNGSVGTQEATRTEGVCLGFCI